MRHFYVDVRSITINPEESSRAFLNLEPMKLALKKEGGVKEPIGLTLVDSGHLKVNSGFRRAGAALGLGEGYQIVPAMITRIELTL